MLLKVEQDQPGLLAQLVLLVLQVEPVRQVQMA